jgi:hypothetical protein
MLARASGVQAFVPCPQPRARIFLSPPTTYHIPPAFVFIDIPASLPQKKNSFFKFLRRFDPSDKLSD